jgi:hypothetical protein
MISYLDPLLFPDQCHVYEVEPGRYVYPIFKNGSSSLKADAKLVNYTDLKQVREVEVFLREPFERYVSGVQTYLRFLPPELDRGTVLAMIGQCLFLNRHFALQFHWLMNLARFSDAWMTFRPISELSTATEHTYHLVARDESLIKYFQDNNKLNYYLLLDKILYENFMGQTVSFKQVVRYIKRHNLYLYNEVIERSQELCSVLD